MKKIFLLFMIFLSSPFIKGEYIFDTDELISIRNNQGDYAAREYLTKYFPISSKPSSADELTALFMWCTLTGNMCDDGKEEYYSEYLTTVDQYLTPLFSDSFKLNDYLDGWLPSIYNRYAAIKIKQHKYKEAIEVLKWVKSWFDEMPEFKEKDEDYPALLEYLCILMCRMTGEYDEAEPFLDEALPLMETVHGNNSSSHLEILYLKSVIVRRKGLYKEALPMMINVIEGYKANNSISKEKIDDLESELKILRELSSDNNSEDKREVLPLYKKLEGQNLYFQNKFQDCIPLLENAISLYEEVNLKDENLLDCFLMLGLANYQLDNYEEAEKYYRKGIILTNFVSGLKEFQYANFYKNLGDLYIAQENFKLAEECYKKIDSNRTAEHEPIYEWIDANEIETLQLLVSNQAEEADKLYSKVVPIILEKYGTYSEQYANALYIKSLILVKKGEIWSAKNYAEQGIKLKDFLIASESVIGCYGELLLCLAYEDKKEDINNILPEALQYISLCEDITKEIAMIYRLIGDGGYWGGHYDLAIKYYEDYKNLNYFEENNVYEEVIERLSDAYLKIRSER